MVIALRNLVIFPIVLCLLFLIPAIITYSNMNYLKTEVNDKIVTTNFLVTLISIENTSFRINFDKKNVSILLQAIRFFEKATSIKLDNLQSFFVSEFPGPNQAWSEVKEARPFPLESVAPIEELYREKAVSTVRQGKINNGSNNTVGEILDIDQRVFIYHTHNWESYRSKKGEKVSEINITNAGDLLAEALKEKGIISKVDKTDVSKELNDKNWGTNKSYLITREIIQEVIGENNQFKYFLDIHRDSFGRKETTTVIGNKSFAKLAFVIGKDNKQYEQNLHFAEYLHEFIQLYYPGVSRGIVGKSGDGVDGVYNQDLSPNMIVIEVGGVENSTDELKNTIGILAEAISSHYWQALEVMAR